jgi:hypothetical protein
MEGALSSQDADVLFTEMPDWLSSIGTGEPAAPASDGTQAITPGELPSWVQAMRPTESSPMEIAQIPTGDQTLETRGALAGLPGVLPAVPGMGPSSKPKAYSIKLQASEEQQAHAALLEQILAAETAPEPIASFAPLATSRLLRWALTAVLFGFISGVLMLRTQFFAVPTVPMDQPNEIGGALNAANAIPESAPVLVVIDYEPALAGEMEAAAAPLLDHAIILRHPSLTFISTSPTGALLAEHLISGPLKERGYQRGNQYVNLGYLPGGLTGVRAFAQNPPATVPLTVDFSPAWQTLPLQRVSSLAQFAAMVVITDNAESARTWIEQTTPWRGAVPVIMVASAQSAPMIRPYYDSHQVNGMVSGLYGGVIFEQSNAGLPGTARKYWDAFSLGMLLAMVLVLGGGFWNLALGLRDRVTAEGK